MYELVEYLFTEVEIDGALGIEPRPSWMDPAELVVALVVGRDLVSYVFPVVIQDKAARWHNRLDVGPREAREAFPFFGNSPKW